MILRFRSHKKVAVVEFMGSRISKAIGSKICVLAKHEYIFSLRAASSSAAEPAVCDAEAMYGAADVQITMTSQVSGFPCTHGTKVRPSGRFPSERDRPFGSLVIGVPVVVKALSLYHYYLCDLIIELFRLVDDILLLLDNK